MIKSGPPCTSASLQRRTPIGDDSKFWKPEFVQFINSWGQDKVLFGTDFPIIDFERATREINELGLKEDSKQKLLWKNTVHVYGLNDFGWKLFS